jgi:oligoribonuclease
MTGLDYDNDEIIQIACYVTDYDLNLLDNEGYETVVHFSKERMDQMGEWCQVTHAASGLTAAVLDAKVTPEQAAEELLAYVKKYAPAPRKALLAGNTVHADQAFLRRAPYDRVIKHLHHRILDVSAIKEAGKRWAPEEVMKKSPPKAGSHEARQDILESIEEARYYQSVFFKRPFEKASVVAAVVKKKD